MGTTVVVTGAAGALGRRLLRRLADDGDVARIVGIDLAPPPELPAGTESRTVDVRDARLADHLAGADVVVHLACVSDPLADATTLHAVNVDGTRNVFESAAAAGVAKVVYASSAMVYGAHPDNDFPLTESSPLRANPDVSFAEHKLDVERWLADWCEQHPAVTVTVLRPAIVAGGGVSNVLVRQLDMPRIVAVRGHRPPWQFAHVDDVVAALSHAVRHDLRGAFNVGCEGWISWEEVTAVTGTRPLGLPEEVAFTLAERLWRVGVAETPAAQLHYLMHPWVVSVDRLCATGWQPAHTNREVLRELREYHAGYVVLPRGVRLRRRDVRIGAVLGGGLVAALALRRALRRD